ncbi:hypothetical protein [Streptomyces sp. NPDC059597]|uniref:hypothetical protein n=1 Tax=Streptomyces sp. NPDC059597 TaxID=3346879 RepID=UPI0036A11BA0
MTIRDGGSAAADSAEVREYCSASAQALENAGLSPGERWDEAGGTAFYWTKGDQALGRGPWAHGIVVFWGTRGGHRGWGCAPLDAAGDPALDALTWLPLAPSIAPDLLAGHLRRLFAEGVAAPERES